MTTDFRRSKSADFGAKAIKAAAIFSVAAVLCILFAIVISIIIDGVLGDVDYDRYREDMLTEIADRRGEYDPQSIVLEQTEEPEARALAERLGAELRMTDNGHFAVLTLPESVTIEDVFKNDEFLTDLPGMSIDYMARISEIEASEEGDGLRNPQPPQYTVTDGSYTLQKYLDYINLNNAWNYTKGNHITVAIIDTGIDTDHPEFEGRISEYSYNASEDKIVKDHLLPDGSYDWSLIEDEHGHGTSVAGVLGASMNSGEIVGIAPRVELLVIKAECDEEGNFRRSSDLVFGLYYAIERDVSVVNMSFGSNLNLYEKPALLARDSDIICVAAAGNESCPCPTYPAADPYVIGVGALDADSWELADYSNFGESVDVVAPGWTYTTDIGGYTITKGTSMSSPIVAGAVALYISRYGTTEFSDIEEVLYASCYDLGTPGPDWYYGYGALDVNAFILEEHGKVSFNMMCDELESEEGVFIRNHTLQNIPEPERNYSVFDGWYYDPQFTEEYGLYEDVFVSDLILYAKWVNEDDGIPFTYVTLDDGTIEISSYKGHRRYITIPDHIDGKIVSSIGENAFSGETRLRQVNLPKYLKIIKYGAFYGCSNLLNITIPDGVTRIENEAFVDNLRLSAVILSSSSALEYIGDGAFSNCAGLRNFNVTSRVKYLNGSAFSGDTSIISFGAAEDNGYFIAEDGVLFSKNKDTIVAYPAGRKGEYDLPDTVKTIGQHAFAYAKITEVDLSSVEKIERYGFSHSWLEELVISDCVKEAEKGAFAFTGYLKKVVIGKGLTEIASSLFLSSGIRSIYIPANIVAINDSAFLISALEEISFAPDSALETIGGDGFYGTYLGEITFPKSLKHIGGEAFCACIFLKKVSFEENSLIRDIGDYAFYQCFNLNSVEFPEGLASIGEFTFAEAALKEVFIPSSVTYVGGGAFAACHSLTDINVHSQNQHYTDVSGVMYTKDMSEISAYPAGKQESAYSVIAGTRIIGKSAFYGSYKLITVELPESLTEIRERAFYENINLGYISIPDNVIQIGRYSFGLDYSLSTVSFGANSKLSRISYAAFGNCGIRSFKIPASVSTIAQEAFLGCRNLEHVTFAENSRLESISAFMFKGCDNLLSITFERGSALTSIQAHGLEGMKKLQSIDLGNARLTNIDNFAFRFCESLERFEIPDGVTYLGRYAFYYCVKLKELIIPESVEFIGRYVCLGADKTNIYFKSDKLPAQLQEDWDYGLGGYYVGVVNVLTEGDWKYAHLSSGDIGIIEYLGNSAAIDMTKLSFGGDIVSIGGGAFANSAVEEVILPESVTLIQAEAFSGSKLKKAIIPKNVTFIGRSAFADTPIESLVFAKGTSVATIEQTAFEGTASLKSVTLPASLETLGRAVFNNSGLESVTFEKGIKLTTIPENAFSYTKLKTVALPDSITLIDNNAFREIPQLESVSFGSGELMIMNHVFYKTGLKELTIPSNITYIGEYAFVALESLTEFKVDEGNKYYTAVDGLLLGDNSRKLVAVPAGRTGELTLPICVETIGFGAFENTALTNIKFDSSANILSFGYRAFYNAQNITDIKIPASVVSIDYYAFAMCRNLKSVTFESGSLLTGVYEGAFYGCESLSDILLPDSIIEISDFAFYGCRSLKSIPVSGNTSLKGIYDYAMAYTGIEGAFTAPAYLVDIGNYAFSGNRITSLTVPNDNARELVIGLGAFYGCNSLKDISLPFIGASFEDLEYSWFSYIFGAGSYEAGDAYIPDSLERVTISEGITCIATNSFREIYKLVHVELPSTVNTLYPDAFRCGINIDGVTFELKNPVYFVDLAGKQVKNVTQAYLSHTKIMGRLDIAEGVERIDDLAFYNCNGISSVSIPEGVTYIGDFAFDGISAVSITLPSTLEYIGDNAFQGGGRLEEIINKSSMDIHLGSRDHGQIGMDARRLVHKDGSVEYKEGYSADICIDTADGFKFIRQDDKYTLVGYAGDKDTVRFPENIFEQEYEIRWRGGAANIIIPGALRGINERAFESARSIRTVVLEEGITRIFHGAFRECAYMTDITLPDTLVEIEGEAFKDCWNIERMVIPDSVKRIGASAFKNCSRLRALNIPKNVEYLGEGVFSSCEKLQLTVSKNNGYLTFEDGILYDKAKEKILYIPDSVTEIEIPATVKTVASLFMDNLNIESVTFEEGSVLSEIGEWAFYYCVNLKHIEIPDSVTAIRAHAFAGCSSLATVKLPAGLEHLEGFDNCIALREIVIPDSVKYITNTPFYGCTSLSKVTLPQGITEIPYGMFEGCAALTNVKIPDSVEKIGERAFSGCPITELEISKDHQYFTLRDGILYTKDMTEPVIVMATVKKAVIPATVTKLNQAFYGSFVVEVSFEEGTKINTLYIGDFCDCDFLTRFTIPKSVTTIEDYTFNSIWTLEYVVNESNLKLEFGSDSNGTIAKNAKVIVDKGVKRYAPDVIDKAFDYIDTEDGFRFKYFNGEYTLISYLGNEETVTLPMDINGKSYEIYELSGVKNVIVPEGVESLPRLAFAGNPLLESVTLPESLLYIADDCFSSSGLKSITLPKNVVSIGSYAFAACHKLESVVLNDGLRNIGGWAFSNCVSLESISFPDSVEYIGGEVFKHSSYRSNPANWKNGALYVGNVLIEVDPNAVFFEVPSSVTCIAYGAFDNCYSLKELSIGLVNEGLLMNMSNLETLVVTEMPNTGVTKYFTRYGITQVPITLKNVVIENGVQMVDYGFDKIKNVNIFVDSLEKDTKWDENFAYWSNNNKVIYSDKWVTACFSNEKGELMYRERFFTHQVIRQPSLNDYAIDAMTYIFSGYDVNGDGERDFIPATSTNDIYATAVYQVYATCDLNGHVSGEWVIPKLSCTEDVLKYRSCEICSVILESETWKATGHALGEWITEKQPTCTENGFRYKICQNCQTRVESENIPAKGHNPSDWITENPISCTESGLVYKTCQNCQVRLEIKHVEATGHTPGEWHTVLKETCAYDGLRVKSCKNCGEQLLSEVITAKGHKEGETIVKKAPSCTEEGVGHIRCAICSEIIVEVNSAALGHTSGEWERSEGGNVEYRKCTACGEILEEIVVVIPEDNENQGGSIEDDQEPSVVTPIIAIIGISVAAIFAIGFIIVKKKR